MKRKILIDCDPGFDDAIAITASHKIEEVDIIGLTVTVGNASLKNTSRNALNLLDTLGWNIPVALGASKPLVRDHVFADEKTGIGNVKLSPSINKFHTKNASDFIYECAKKYEGDLEILAIAPMTNIAMALTKYPDLKDKIKSITVMGGTSGKGNIRPWAEFNVYLDPHAADVVLKSGIPITMVGLDVTNQASIMTEDIDYFKGLNTIHGDLIGDLLQAIYDRECLFEENTVFVHDLVALYSMIYPENIRTKKFKVHIDKGEENPGMLILDYRDVPPEEKNVNISIAIDVGSFRQWIRDLISQ